MSKSKGSSKCYANSKPCLLCTWRLAHRKRVQMLSIDNETINMGTNYTGCTGCIQSLRVKIQVNQTHFKSSCTLTWGSHFRLFLSHVNSCMNESEENMWSLSLNETHILVHSFLLSWISLCIWANLLRNIKDKVVLEIVQKRFLKPALSRCRTGNFGLEGNERGQVHL